MSCHLFKNACSNTPFANTYLFLVTVRNILGVVFAFLHGSFFFMFPDIFCVEFHTFFSPHELHRFFFKYALMICF